MKWKCSKPVPLALAIVAVVLALPAGYLLGHWAGRLVGGAPSGESPLNRAHRLCGECGLDAGEVDRLIEDVRSSGANRETAVKLWEDTYADPVKLAEARELCGGSVAAVVDVASPDQPAPPRRP